MRQARPGDYSSKKSVLEEFEVLGGDRRFLKRLTNHPALKIIQRLDKAESERAKLTAKLAEVNETLNQAASSLNGVAAELTTMDDFKNNAQRWLKNFQRAVQIIGHIKLGLEVERFNHGGAQRYGLFVNYPERYFYCAFLVPYTAWLRQRHGKRPSPNWKWIERWLQGVKDLEENHDLRLASWWSKEVIKRKSWPSSVILYALAAGAAVFLETSKNGRRARWVTEWDRAKMPRKKEGHPLPLKRRLNAEDRNYLKCLFEQTPIVRKEFERAYPELESTAKTKRADPLEIMLEKKAQKALEKLPARARILIAKLQRKPLNVKALLKKEIAALKKKNV
ncbi:MAG: hypothetical protein AAB091_03050 [Elusimicrobiota bacterium]